MSKFRIKFIQPLSVQICNKMDDLVEMETHPLGSSTVYIQVHTVFILRIPVRKVL